jgi:hypothetical protein
MPKHYNLAKIQDAPIANTNAVIGGNEITRIPNNTPNAPKLRCKFAELVKLVFVIDNSFNNASVSYWIGKEAIQTFATRFGFKAGHLRGSNPTGWLLEEKLNFQAFFTYNSGNNSDSLSSPLIALVSSAATL